MTSFQLKHLALTLIFVSGLVAACSLYVWTVSADQWFDSWFLPISRVEERIHLDNFAYYLERDPKLIGYVLQCTEDEKSRKKAARDVSRMRKYLIKEFKIPSERIVAKASICSLPITVLQPVDKSSSWVPEL